MICYRAYEGEIRTCVAEDANNLGRGFEDMFEDLWN